MRKKWKQVGRCSTLSQEMNAERLIQFQMNDEIKCMFGKVPYFQKPLIWIFKHIRFEHLSDEITKR